MPKDSSHQTFVDISKITGLGPKSFAFSFCTDLQSPQQKTDKQTNKQTPKAKQNISNLLSPHLNKIPALSFKVTWTIMHCQLQCYHECHQWDKEQCHLGIKPQEQQEFFFITHSHPVNDHTVGSDTKYCNVIVNIKISKQQAHSLTTIWTLPQKHQENRPGA